MEKEHLSGLLKKYVNGQCTPEELKVIDQWFSSHEDNPDDDRLVDVYERENLETKMFERIKANVELKVDAPESSRGNVWYRAAAAIAILMVAGLGIYLYNEKGLFSENSV